MVRVRWVGVAAIVVILWIFTVPSAEASHVFDNGLPQRPPKVGKAPTKVFDWHLYAQGRYTDSEDAGSRFSLRRLKLNGGGHPYESFKWFVQGIYKDGNDSPTDGQVFFQEGWVAYQFGRYLQLSTVQLKPPFGMERFTSDARIYSINRSQATNHLVPNGQLGDSFTRDYGLLADGWLQGNRWYYALGFFEGEGANNPIKQPSPMVTTRIVYWLMDDKPFHGRDFSLHVGGAFSLRNANDLDLSRCCPGPQSVALRNFNGRDLRWNLELGADWGDTSLRAEYFQADFHFRESTAPDFTANGWYVQAAQYLGRYVQGVLKFEGFDPDTSIVNQEDIFWTTLGLNVYFNGNRAKLMADYIWKQEAADSFSNNTFLLQVQLYFK